MGRSRRIGVVVQLYRERHAKMVGIEIRLIGVETKW